jgi:hypothetical protein
MMNLLVCSFHIQFFENNFIDHLNKNEDMENWEESSVESVKETRKRKKSIIMIKKVENILVLDYSKITN